VAVAVAGDTVNVLPGTYFEHDLALNERVTLRGVEGAAATTIDAQGQGRVLYLSYIETLIEGLTITGGASGLGAGIYAEFGSGGHTIRDCVITDNHAINRGGGMLFYHRFSAITVSDCVVSANTAGSSGGGLVDEKGDFTEPLVVTNCLFEGNAAGNGGGMAIDWGRVTCAQCRFVGNTADSRGGGFVIFSPSIALVEECTFYANSATEGGGIYDWDDGSGGVRDFDCIRSIIAFSPSGGGFDSITPCRGTFYCCDIYGNTGGDSFCGTDLGGNFSLDPLFCDAENGDLQLDGHSPCLPGNHPDEVDCAGVIGALGVGCGATPVNDGVESASWSLVKNRYR
jgi:hypothetical protein